MESNVFQIKTAVFEGPLELLVQLIEKRKLFINDISLATVTDDYIAYIKSVGHFPMRQAASFILIASTLLLLKSKSLLPTLNLTLEEEGSIDDLERRLRLYKYFQAISKSVYEILGKNIIYPKVYTKVTDPIFSPQKDITSKNLHTSIQSVINRLPKVKVEKAVAVEKTISLEETLLSLTKRVKANLKLSFNEFSDFGKAEKINVIISFLAMLELVKQEAITVSQENHFEDIHMESSEPGLPQY